MSRAAVILLLVGWATTGLSQGSVYFQNSLNSFNFPADRLVYFGEVGGGKLVGTNYAAALYYTLPDTTELIPVPGAVRLFRLPTTTLPGTWNPSPAVSVNLPGVAPLTSTTLQVRVWDIQVFETWETAIASGGLHGESTPFFYFVPIVPYPEPAWSLNNLQAFAVIPEPSVFGLCLLGAGVWWFLRAAPANVAARRSRR